MNQYGQAESFEGTLLEVNTIPNYVVGFRLEAPKGFSTAYLTIHEVKLLITQLQTWIDKKEG